MSRTKAKLLLHIVALAAALACSASSGSPFWESGKKYDLTLVVGQRSPSLEEARRFKGDLRDTVPVRLSVERVQSDSVFGTYEADWRQLGVWVGPPSGSHRQHFAARQERGEFTLRLSPGAVDGGMELQGRVEADAGQGTWGVDGGALRGRFRVQRN